MLTLEQLKQAVHKKGIIKTDIVLLCLAAAGGKSASIAQIKKLAVDAGVKGAKDIYYSQHLSAAKIKAFNTPDGWELTDDGRKHVASLAAIQLSVSPAATQAQTLRALLPKIKSADVQAFILEGIVCAEQSLSRAAVVLSWVGAMALLHDHVVSTHLSAFNAEATKRDPKWKPAKDANDLGKMKEKTFLEICDGLFLGKNVVQQLQAALTLRNACGHPTPLKVGPNNVAAHIEMLTLNVYSVYG